jgi:hypothetical protein
MSSPVYVAEGESECDGVADDGGVGFLRTGRSQAGEGRPVPSGTRGESTGMLQTGRALARLCGHEHEHGHANISRGAECDTHTHCDKIRR